MGRSFHIELKRLDHGTYVKLAGVINEDNELLAIGRGLSRQTIVIDLGELREINSCGVRDWVRWLGALGERENSIVLIECPPLIIHQVNQVSNFGGNAHIKTFYMPYYCKTCDTEKALLADVDEFDRDSEIIAPSCRCDACDSIMVFDDLPGSYFSFAKAVVPLPESSRDALRTFVPRAGSRKVRSSAELTGLTFTNIRTSATPSALRFGPDRRTTRSTPPVEARGRFSRRRPSSDTQTSGRPMRDRRLLRWSALLLGCAVIVAATLLLWR